MNIRAWVVEILPKEGLTLVGMEFIDDQDRPKHLMKPFPTDWVPLLIERLNGDQRTPDEFEAQALAIYERYPYKKGRIPAIKAIINALKFRSFAYLMEMTERYSHTEIVIEEMKKPIGQKKYLPYPATWFNRGRYDDDDLKMASGVSAERAAFLRAQKDLQERAP